MKVKAIIFDFGFTLFYFKNATVNNYFECFKEGLLKSIKFLQHEKIFGKNTDIKEFITMFNKVRLASYRNNDKSFRELTTPSLFKKILQEFEVQINNEKIYYKLADLYHSCEEREWFPFADTQKTLETLKQKGLKIGLISNHPYHLSILNMLETHNLKNYFDAIMTSARFGKRKPHIEIFLKTILKMGLSEETNHQTIMCGDEYADIIGASKAGLIPVLYHRKVEFPYEKEINLSNIKTIEGIYDIIEIIENFNK